MRRDDYLQFEADLRGRVVEVSAADTTCLGLCVVELLVPSSLAAVAGNVDTQEASDVLDALWTRAGGAGEELGEGNVDDALGRLQVDEDEADWTVVVCWQPWIHAMMWAERLVQGGDADDFVRLFRVVHSMFDQLEVPPIDDGMRGLPERSATAAVERMASDLAAQVSSGAPSALRARARPFGVDLLEILTAHPDASGRVLPHTKAQRRP
jgi:hypothetical protein